MKKENLNQKTLFDYFNSVLVLLLALFTIFPFYYVIIISVADYASISKAPVYLFPTSFNLESYKLVFRTDFITSSLMVSTFVTITGTLLSMLMSLCAAYALSKQNMPGRNLAFSYIILPMFFSGGLIPYYLTVKAAGLVDSIFVLVIPMAVNTFYVIILKNYFQTFPSSLEESAKIDGANDIYILWKIILPTSAPIIATISLFYAVDRWNEWWHALLFISTRSKFPLQMVLRQILFDFQQTVGSAIGRSILMSKELTYTRSIQMAIVVIATIPILLVYPFLQKYFTKGIMLGSIKE